MIVPALGLLWALIGGVYSARAAFKSASRLATVWFLTLFALNIIALAVCYATIGWMDITARMGITK